MLSIVNFINLNILQGVTEGRWSFINQNEYVPVNTSSEIMILKGIKKENASKVMNKLIDIYDVDIKCGGVEQQICLPPKLTPQIKLLTMDQTYTNWSSSSIFRLRSIKWSEIDQKWIFDFRLNQKQYLT